MTVSPISSPQRRSSARASPSSFDSAGRLLPPPGMGPICAISISRSQSRSGERQVHGFTSPAVASAASASTCMPAVAHSGVMLSASLWLSPPWQGQKTMTVGTLRAM